MIFYVSNCFFIISRIRDLFYLFCFVSFFCPVYTNLRRTVSCVYDSYSFFELYAEFLLEFVSYNFVTLLRRADYKRIDAFYILEVNLFICSSMLGSDAFLLALADCNFKFVFIGENIGTIELYLL